MITIYSDDLPIEVAAKLITSTVKVKRSALDIVMACAAGRETAEEVDVRIFDKQELKAIAEHLLIYVNEDEE
ncbi:MAG: hypothetical protein HXL87_01455 [[Eubacterium] sulci]|jgi:hypothetical protein|nr:hypothetical protein [[Eubacterium] sulci]